MEDVQKIFDSYPPKIRKKILVLRELILEVARKHPEIGPLEETLRWGEPSYIPSKTKSGSLVRIAWKKSKPNQYAMYFHCGTTLVDEFAEKYGDLFEYEGNRALVFQEAGTVPKKELSDCIKESLTYHLREKK